MNMRTNVVIDDKLMRQAMESGNYRTKRKTIEEGLRLLLQVNSQKKIRELKGRIRWEGDLEEMRGD